MRRVLPLLEKFQLFINRLRKNLILGMLQMLMLIKSPKFRFLGVLTVTETGELSLETPSNVFIQRGTQAIEEFTSISRKNADLTLLTLEFELRGEWIIKYGN